MQDRVPIYPGRVKLAPVSGQQNVYDMTRADQPSQEGTPLNKATLLKDATATLFGLTSSAVPDDVFKILAQAALYKSNPSAGFYDVSDNLLLKLPGVQIETGSYVGTGTYGSSNPNSLTFGFAPKLVLIETANDLTNIMVALSPMELATTTNDNSNYSAVTLMWSNNVLSWYTSSAAPGTQLNTSGYIYNYIAIG